MDKIARCMIWIILGFMLLELTIGEVPSLGQRIHQLDKINQALAEDNLELHAQYTLGLAAKQEKIKILYKHLNKFYREEEIERLF